MISMPESHEVVAVMEVRAVPAQRPAAPRQTGLLTSSAVLDGGGDRAARAQQVLDELASQWGLPPGRFRRCLASAGAVLDEPAPVELFVQYDRVTQLLTLELWAHGKVAFGIDDWLGV